MSGFIEGEDRHQATLSPESPDEHILEDSAVRLIDVFIDDPDISGLGLKAEPAGGSQLGTEPQARYLLVIDEHSDESNRAVFFNLIVESSGKKVP